MSYNRAADLLVAALDLPPAERAAYLDQTCGADAALRADVESLIASAEGAAASRIEIDADGLPALISGRAGMAALGPGRAFTAAVKPLAAGERVGPYDIEGLLGAGGMGVVYRARDTRLGRTIALKAIPPQFSDDEAWRERLRREARAAAALTHPGVATVYALEEIDRRLYLATELCAGETLRDVITRGPLGAAEVVAVGRQLADALAAAHDRRVIHRDLKPENVMRLADGTIKILDFGLARIDQSSDDGATAAAAHHTAHPTATGAVFGTPAYMAPEQLRGDRAGAAADIFAVGLVLAELATGRHPFDAPGRTAVMARTLTAEPDLAGVPPDLQAILRTCLEKSPSERYRSAHELRAALDALVAGRAPRGAARRPAFWWWQFHQAATSVFELALAISLWVLHGSSADRFTPLVSMAATIAALVAITVRLHRLFAVRIYPTSANPYHALTTGADLVLAAAAIAGGALVTGTHPYAAVLLIASAAVLAIVTTVVEPATARAARI